MTALKQALLIEDNEIAQRIPAIILNDNGIHVDIVTSGQAAIDAVKQSNPPYDLILLDIGLPDMNGFDVAEHIRSQPNFSGITIIGLTAHLDIDNSCPYLNETLSKPFSSKMLNHIIEHYFKA